MAVGVYLERDGDHGSDGTHPTTQRVRRATGNLLADAANRLLSHRMLRDRNSRTAAFTPSASKSPGNFWRFPKRKETTSRRRILSSDFQDFEPGDRWCLCAERWQQAFEAAAAPRVVLKATHEATLAFVDLADLKRHALDLA